MPKKEVSNKQLAILLIVAIAFSIVCTWAITSRNYNLADITSETASFADENLIGEESPEASPQSSQISLTIIPKEDDTK